MSRDADDGTVTTAAFGAIHGVTAKTVRRWIDEGRPGVEAEKCPGGYRWRVKLKKSITQSDPKQPKAT